MITPLSRLRKFLAPAACVAAGLLAAGSAHAAGTLGDVFYIEMENHNLTQPSGQTSPAALQGNPAAPYLNSLMTPGNANAAQSSWASDYVNSAVGVHPSLPNYLWQEQGTNNGVFNDNTPFGAGGANQGNTPSLTGLIQSAGISWKSYQEDTDTDAAGNVLPQSQWTVPLNNRSGSYTTVPNAYNGSLQYNFATKHDGQLYFNATNGGNDTSPSNPEVPHYAPLQQLQTDLTNNTVARYSLITPNQFNDMHSTLTGGFTYNGVHYNGDAASIAQGDNFLSIIVPQIMASQAYKNNGAIVIWYDETEGGDDAQHTLPEIILSPLAKGNGYEVTTTLNHSSDLKTLENVFGLAAPGGGYLGHANDPGVSTLAGFFQPGVVPAAVPEPSSIVMMGLGVAGLGVFARRRLARKPA